MKKPVAITLEDQPANEDLEVVREGLAFYNKSNAPKDDHERMSLFLRDQNDLVIGGLLGGTYWGWLTSIGFGSRSLRVA